MKISVEKGRMLAVGCQWVHFILCNPDIMTTLNSAPLILLKTSEKHFSGTIFGVNIKLKTIGINDPKPSGEVDVVSDVIMPIGLGKTYTVAHYRYRLIDADMTMVDLRFDLETTGILMAIYAVMRKRSINDYINRVLSDNERAANLVKQNDPCIERLLSKSQIDRVNSYRATYGTC